MTGIIWKTVRRLGLGSVILAAPCLLAAARLACAEAESNDILVAGKVCETIQHLADAPGVAYSPGLDVHGNEVAPADLPDPGRQERDAYFGAAPVRITRGLQQRIAQGRPAFRGYSELGYVTVSNGQAFLDGRPLTADEQGLLSAACRDPRR